MTSETCSIDVGDKVQLRRHLPGFPGALVYKSCNLSGPLVGRLVGHEHEDGSNAIVTKIKVEVSRQRHGKVSQTSTSAFASVQSETDHLTPTRVSSPRSRILESEHQSASKSKTELPQQSVDTETWDVDEVVFLESENKVLGEVAAVDGPHVIVKVANVPLPNKSSLRVFKISELETVPEGPSGTSMTGQCSSTSVYRGCIQHVPKCILDSKKPFSQTNNEVLTGLNPIAMTTMQTGISLLVERVLDGKAFYLGPVTDQAKSTNKVYTCSTDATTSVASDEGSSTAEYESAPCRETALLPVPVSPTLPVKSAGQKRKRSESDDDTGPEEIPTVFTHGESSNLVSSKFDRGNHKCPVLQAANDSGIVLLCDSNGCLYPRPYGTKLSSPSSRQMPPLQFLSSGWRYVPSSVAERSDERMLMLLVGKFTYIQYT